MKILANSNALSLNSVDKDSSIITENNVYKGVEIYPSISTNVGMFGMKAISGSPNAAELCIGDIGDSARICSTYSNYVNYLEAKTDNTNRK